MSDNPQKGILLEKYGGKTFPPLKRPDPVRKAPGEYQALVEQRQGRTVRFKIVDRSEISYGSGYAFLLGWLFTPPDLLTIQTTTHSFTLEGRNLERIERALMDEKMRELYEYNPERHQPPGEDDIIIEKLEIKSRFEEGV